MEILVGIAVLLVLIFFITGDWGIVVLTIAGLAAFFTLALTGFFIFFLCRFLNSEKRTAVFLRFEKRGKNKFENAVYELDGSEYPDVFPAEPIFRKRIYKEGVPVKLRFSEKRGVVYDRNTAVTVIAGTAAFAASSAFIILIFVGLF